MDDPTVVEVERWLRELAQASERAAAEHAPDASADAASPAHEQDRPYWPYLESDDFWRE